MQYLRSLKFGQKFTLRTSIVAISGKNAWFQQVQIQVLYVMDSFECGGKVYAIAMMRMVFLDKNYRITNSLELSRVSDQIRF